MVSKRSRNVGEARGKMGPASIGCVLQNNKGEVVLFLKKIGVKESSDTEVLAILEALQMFVHYSVDKLILESNSSNAITWISSFDMGPW